MPGHAATQRRGAHALAHRPRQLAGLHQQRIQRQPFKRAGGVAEHALGLGVGARHPAVRPDQQDPVRRFFENPAQESFAALDRALGFAQGLFGALGLVALDGTLAQQRRGLYQRMADVQRLVERQRRQHHLLAMAEGDCRPHHAAQRSLDPGADQRHQGGAEHQQRAAADDDPLQRTP